MNETQMVVLLLALVVGVMLRTYLTFQQKVQNAREKQLRDPSEQIPEFNHVYTGTAIASFASALVTALLLFPEAVEMLNPDLGYVGMFVFGVIYALGWNEIWNRYVAPVFVRK